MSTNGYLVLHASEDRESVLEALEQGRDEPLDEVERSGALRAIDAVLEAHRRAREAGIDTWMTKSSRQKAARELDKIAGRMAVLATDLEALSPLAQQSLRLDTFDQQSPLGRLLVDANVEYVGLQAGTLKSAMKVYWTRFRDLVGLVDSVKPMVRILKEEQARCLEADEARPERGWDGQPDGAFGPPLEGLRVAIRRYGALADIKAEDLRDHVAEQGRPAAATERVLTLSLARIWRDHTGHEATLDNYSGESPFLGFARLAANMVDPAYDGEAPLREIIGGRGGTHRKQDKKR